MATLTCPVCRALVTRAATSLAKGPRRSLLHEFREVRWEPGQGSDEVLFIDSDHGRMALGLGRIDPQGSSVGFPVHPHQPRLP